jgi:hypothetical protein
MTLTPTRTANQIHAARTILERLDRLPDAVSNALLAVQSVHAKIDTMGRRQQGVISDPTQSAALGQIERYEREVENLDDQLRTLALTLSLLRDFMETWAPVAVDHPKCVTAGCGAYVEHSVRNDGSISYRGTGTCVNCRRRAERARSAA